MVNVVADYIIIDDNLMIIDIDIFTNYFLPCGVKPQCNKRNLMALWHGLKYIAVPGGELRLMLGGFDMRWCSDIVNAKRN